MKEYGITPLIYDPMADKKEAKEEYGLEFDELKDMKDLDVAVFAVNHDAFKEFTGEKIETLFKDVPNNNKVLVDIKNILDRKYFEEKGYNVFRL